MILAQLKTKREAKEITQEFLARKIGKTARTISTYERGGNVKLFDALKIARTLHCSLDDLTSKPEELVTTGEG
jgi:transcriptional regulator with XRE-family HTH domain